MTILYNAQFSAWSNSTYLRFKNYEIIEFGIMWSQNQKVFWAVLSSEADEYVSIRTPKEPRLFFNFWLKSFHSKDFCSFCSVAALYWKKKQKGLILPTTADHTSHFNNLKKSRLSLACWNSLILDREEVELDKLYCFNVVTEFSHRNVVFKHLVF